MTKHLETKALFAGYNPADNHGAIKPPMHPSSTFVFRTAAEGAALMETASSGIEVPNPIITALISNLETQKLCANEMQPFNNIFPPRKRRTIPDNI